MKFVWALLLAFPLLAENVPGRYIVELAAEPVATHIRGQGRAAFHGPAAQRHRQRVRAEQSTARSRVRQLGGAVSAAVENVKNAVVVEIDDAKAGQLAAMPGVRKVYPVRTFHLMLDHALPIHRVAQALVQAGAANAGAGVKIAIIDTGVDVRHPGFADAGFTAPEGFPRGELEHTNKKVIVARSYVAMLPRPDADLSAADRIGHGTGTAMAAAGVTAAGPLATIGGVAPGAYIGSYKVVGSPASNPTSTEDTVLRAIDDAVADGMDVINLSMGSDIATPLADDPEMQALENASALGIVVVCSAGNNGPDPMTTGSPAGGPSVIAVGASGNDRFFSARVIGPGGQPFRATPGAASAQAPPLTGKLIDVAKLDGDGLACNPLPGGSLTAAIALISRGSCNFEVKINYAQAAGAVAALVYNNVEGAPVSMGVGTATLPAEMVSLADGGTLREHAATGGEVTLQFTPGPVYSDPQRLESFSAVGPYVDFGIKPDLVAVGGSLYTGAQSADPRGVMYDATGFKLTQGTSFSAPIVAGAAAVLKSTRPGLSSAQYRSLLVNTAAPAWSVPGARARIQQSGGGNLDLLAAVSSTVAAAPVSISFGASSGTVQLTRQLTIWNLGKEADTFRLSIAPLRGGRVPELPVSSVALEPGASATVPVVFAGSGLTAGEYEGFVEIQPSRATFPSRAPYWHGVSSAQPRNFTILTSKVSGTAGATVSDAVIFRITDEFGLPVSGFLPSVQAISGGGEFGGLRVYSNVPFGFSATLKLGLRPGANVFRFQVGEISRDVTVIGQ